MLRPALVALAALTTAACAATPPVRAQAPHSDAVQVDVLRAGDTWTAEFVFDRPAPVWAFRHSALARETRRPWRPEQWRVLTPGVRLERHGYHDVLVADGPMPRRVRIALSPAPVDLEAEYDPALVFSDGSVALYSDQFDLIPLSSTAAAAALPLDLNGVPLEGGPSAVTYRDRAGPVLANGRREQAPTLVDGNTYVLFGRTRTVETPAFTAIVDPGLSTWIGDELSAFIPRVMDEYGSRLGPSGGPRPTVMVSWTGPTAGLRSMGGSVLPGLIVMTFEGQVLTVPDAEISTAARWFIGHEAAHFWLGQTVRYEYARDAWITEGGADIMAIRALAAIDRTYDARAALQTSVDDCIALTSGGRSVGSAAERGEHRAYYACGAVFWMVAEASLRHANRTDVFDVIRPLLEDNRADGVLTAQEWRDHLSRISDDPTLARDIQRMTDEGVDNPATLIANLFDRAGVRHERTADGGVRLS